MKRPCLFVPNQVPPLTRSFVWLYEVGASQPAYELPVPDARVFERFELVPALSQWCNSWLIPGTPFLICCEKSAALSAALARAAENGFREQCFPRIKDPADVDSDVFRIAGRRACE